MDIHMQSNGQTAGTVCSNQQSLVAPLSALNFKITETARKELRINLKKRSAKRSAAISLYTLGACVIVALVVICIFTFLELGGDPKSIEYAFSQVKEIRSVSDIEHHKSYVTYQGKRILNVLTLDPDTTKLDFHPVFNDVIVNGENCSIQFHDGETAGELQFRKEQVWQLDNIVFARINGHTLHADMSLLVDPLRAFIEVSKDKTPGDVSADNRYFTNRGKRVWLKMLELKTSHSESENSSTLFGDPIVNPNLVQFPVLSDDGKSEGQFLLVCDAGLWKFDGFYVLKSNGETIDLRVSDQIDHPILSSLKLLFQ